MSECKHKRPLDKSEMHSPEVCRHFSTCIIHGTHLLSRQLPSPLSFVLYSAMFSPRAIIIHYKCLQSTVTELHYDEVGLFEFTQLDNLNAKQMHLCRCNAATFRLFSHMKHPVTFHPDTFKMRLRSKCKNCVTKWM